MSESRGHWGWLENLVFAVRIAVQGTDGPPICVLPAICRREASEEHPSPSNQTPSIAQAGPLDWFIEGARSGLAAMNRY